MPVLILHILRWQIEFYNLQRVAKVGTIPTNIILDKWSFDTEIGRKIKFRHVHDGNIWFTGIVRDKNENCIFIDLL